MPLIKDSTNIMQVPNLVNGLTLAPVATATITFTLYDPSGSTVSGATNLSMSYSSGVYSCTIPNTVALTEGYIYLGIATAVDALGTRLMYVKEECQLG